MLGEGLHSGATSLHRKCTPNVKGAVIIQLTACSVYQEYLAKTLTDKYGNLNVQVDKIVNDANAELGILHQKLAGECGITRPLELINVTNSDANRPGQTQDGKHQFSCRVS